MDFTHRGEKSASLCKDEVSSVCNEHKWRLIQFNLRISETHILEILVLCSFKNSSLLLVSKLMFMKYVTSFHLRMTNTYLSTYLTFGLHPQFAEFLVRWLNRGCPIVLLTDWETFSLLVFLDTSDSLVQVELYRNISSSFLEHKA